MTQPELVLFDCDGVLLDSEVPAHQALVDVVKDYGVEMTLKEALQRYTGLSSREERADIEARYGVTLPEECFVRRRARVAELFEQELHAIPGVADLIKALPMRKCVASGSSLNRLRQSLGLTGLWSLFDPHVFSAKQVARGKPAPDLFLFAAQQMGVAPEKCLVIEDSCAGVQAARAANMRVFGFTGASHCGPGHDDLLRQQGAEQVFEAMPEIAALLV